MTVLLCTCGRKFEALIADGEITIKCETCAPIDWQRLKRAERKAS